MSPTPLHVLRLELSERELMALFQLLRGNEQSLDADLARVARVVERAVYERLTIEQLEALRGASDGELEAGS